MVYLTKPVLIEAIQWTGDNEEAVTDFLWHSACVCWTVKKDRSIDVVQFGGNLQIACQDFIIRDPVNEVHRCRSDVFKEMYDEVSKS